MEGDFEPSDDSGPRKFGPGFWLPESEPERENSVLSVVRQIKEMLEEQFAFSNVLREQIAKSQGNSLLEIFAAFYLGGILDTDLFNSSRKAEGLDERKIKEIKCIRQKIFICVNCDVRRFKRFIEKAERILNAHEQEKVDHLCIELYFWYETCKLDNQLILDPWYIPTILSLLGINEKQIIKRVKKKFRRQNNKQAATSLDLKTSKQCLDWLIPHISPSCKLFTKSLEHARNGTSLCFGNIFIPLHRKLNALKNLQPDGADSLHEFMYDHYTKMANTAECYNQNVGDSKSKTPQSERLLNWYRELNKYYSTVVEIKKVLKKIKDFGDQPVSFVQNASENSFCIQIIPIKETPEKSTNQSTTKPDGSNIRS